MIKSCGCKKTTVGAKKSENCSCVFPEKELKQWLKKRKAWDHDEWLSLLEDLRRKGYSEWVDCNDGRTQIGEFLESNREKF